MDTSERQRHVAQEAAEWWLILQDDASRSQRERYVDWLRESSAHVAEMLHVAQVHGALEQFQGWSALPVDEPRANSENVVRLTDGLRSPATQSGRPAVRRRRRVAVAAAAAAAVLLAVAVIAVLQLGRNEVVIRTERGERREVALADGSVVQIDPETRLRVSYRKHVRRVFLESGRALFHVAKNSERPFLVEASETTVRAVGTAFAVEKNQNESLVVTVAEGTVAVFPSQSPGTAPQSAASAANLMKQALPANEASLARGADGPVLSQLPGGSRAQLFATAGQQVLVAKAGGPETIRAVDSARALAWAEGRLIFDNSSVADAVRQFNRYNRIQIIVNDQTVAHRVINGTFDAADPESFAAFMQSVARVHISRNERADITVDAVN